MGAVRAWLDELRVAREASSDATPRAQSPGFRPALKCDYAIGSSYDEARRALDAKKAKQAVSSNGGDVGRTAGVERVATASKPEEVEPVLTVAGVEICKKALTQHS